MGKGRKRKGGGERFMRRDFKEARKDEWQEGRTRQASKEQTSSVGQSYMGWQLDSESFKSYYRAQKIMPEEDFPEFLNTMRRQLPATFRINGSGQYAQKLRERLQTDFFQNLDSSLEVDGERVVPPKPFPWYPDNLAWQMNFSRNQLRKLQKLKRIHNFLKVESEGGTISRQEAVSMVPPLVLDVEPHHKVLDMCAAPGSKTFQLLEMLHSSQWVSQEPSGIVVANDVDVKRCHLLVHQTKRMCTPAMLVTNHEAQFFPTLRDGNNNPLEFDRIICDVPCSGDGTFRKSPDAWRKWHVGLGNGLHRLQCKIATRAAQLLKVGGRLVYSTCSLNPIENEAVVAEILRVGRGSLKLLDVADRLPGLIRREGLKTWKVGDKHGWYETIADVPENSRNVHPSMFPPSSQEEVPDEVTGGDAKVDMSVLTRCLRIYPHMQDTGGFFVSVFLKVAKLENESEGFKRKGRMEPKAKAQETELHDPTKVLSEDPAPQQSEDAQRENAEAPTAEDAQEKAANAPAAKESSSSSQVEFRTLNERWKGLDPVHSVLDQGLIDGVRAFYGISSEVELNSRIVTRSAEGKPKRLYYVSEAIRNVLVSKNSDQLRVVATGLKLFERQEMKDGSVSCPYRLAQDGLLFLLPHLQKQHVKLPLKDFQRLVTTRTLPLSSIDPASNATLSRGCCAVSLLKDDEIDTSAARSVFDAPIAVCCWKGGANLNLLVTKQDVAVILDKLKAENGDDVSIPEEATGGGEAPTVASLDKAAEDEDRSVPQEAIGGDEAPMTAALDELKAENGGDASIPDGAVGSGAAPTAAVLDTVKAEEVMDASTAEDAHAAGE